VFAICHLVGLRAGSAPVARAKLAPAAVAAAALE
jgi:hypothetical protein